MTLSIRQKFIAFLFLVPLLCHPVQAQDEEEEGLEQELEEEFELVQLGDEEIVSAARHRQKLGQSPSAVLVITRREIEASGAVLLTDLLRRWPVFNVFDFDPLSSNTTVRSMYRAVLLVDGREVNHDLFPTPIYHTIPIDLSQVERVEVVLGPTSAIYGANAVSAVMNVFTRRPTVGTHSQAHFRAGEYGASHLQVNLSQQSGNWAFQASGGGTFSNSWMEQGKEELSIWRSLVRAEYQHDEFEFDVDAGFSRTRGNCHSLFGSLYFPVAWMGHAQAVFRYREFSLRSYWYSLIGQLDLDVGLYYPPLKVTLGKIPLIDMTGHTVHNEVQYNLEPWAGNYLVLGADTRYTRYHAQQLVDDTVWEVRAGVYFHDEQRLGEKWLLQAGLRYDWNSRTDQALSPRGALIYSPAPEQYLRLSGGLAFRKPSMMETSMNLEIEPNPVFPEVEDLFEKYGLSNPDLRNELLSSVELGWRASWLERRLNTSLDLYLAFNRNVIAFFSNVVFDQTALGPRLNLEKSKVGFEAGDEDNDVYGLDAEIKYLVADWLEVFLRFSIDYAFFVDQNYRQKPYYPSQRAAVGINLFGKSSWWGSLVLAANNASTKTLRPPDSIFMPEKDVAIPARFYAMLFLGRKFDLGLAQLELTLNVFNPFNVPFREEPGNVRADGSRFGGEIQSRRLMLGVGLEY